MFTSSVEGLEGRGTVFRSTQKGHQCSCQGKLMSKGGLKGEKLAKARDPRDDRQREQEMHMSVHKREGSTSRNCKEFNLAGGLGGNDVGDQVMTDLEVCLGLYPVDNVKP